MNNSIENKILIKEYNGVGLSRAVESGSWYVGIKNFKPENSVDKFNVLEKHLETEEVFILLSGECTLIIDDSKEGNLSHFTCIKMEKDKVYCINRNVYHTTVISEDVKLILVENRNTSAENSEFYNLSEDEIKELKKQI